MNYPGTVFAACYKPSCFHLYEDCINSRPLAWGWDEYDLPDAIERIRFSRRSFGKNAQPDDACCKRCRKRWLRENETSGPVEG